MLYRHRVATFLLLTLLPLPVTLAAQERFDPEVYSSDTEPRGAWELETHLSYTASGTRTFDGAVVPTEHQSRLALEVTRGITDIWEVSGYVLGATGGATGPEFAGWRVRTQVRAPAGWRLPLGLALAAELGRPEPAFSEGSWTLELTPVLEKRWGGVVFGLNPSVERDLQGPEAADGWELEPGARIAVDLSRHVTLEVQYFAALGHLKDPLPLKAQVHQVMPGITMHLGDDIGLSLGAGIGTTSAGDRFVLTSRFEMPLGGEGGLH